MFFRKVTFSIFNHSVLLSADEKVGLSSRCCLLWREFPIDFFSTFVSFDAVQCVPDREMFLFSALKGFTSHQGCRSWVRRVGNGHLPNHLLSKAIQNFTHAHPLLTKSEIPLSFIPCPPTIQKLPIPLVISFVYLQCTYFFRFICPMYVW